MPLVKNKQKRDVNNVDNSSNLPKPVNLKDKRIIKIKSNQSFNESNLMTLPFISLKREKVFEINRTWIRDGKEVGLKVKATDLGCPTIYELDVIMALFRILARSMDNEIVVLSEKETDDENNITKDTKTVTNLKKVINFTYRGLAREIGLKGFGKSTKVRLEKSIRCLNECTIYSTLAIRDKELGEYIVDFNGLESSRIFKNYKSYSITNFKKADKTLLDPNKVEDYQSIEIDDFFFNNMCNNYFKIYDHDKYKQLTQSIAKKLLLILTQWSHGYEKNINMQTLYDHIGLEVNNKDDEYYYNKQLKKALDELVLVEFIQGYNINSSGVNFIFNATRKISAKGLDKYINDNEIVARLRAIGVEYEDITKYCRLDTMGYISALLRYIDYRHEKGYVKDIKKFTLKGLPFERYEVDDFMVE